MDNFLYIAAGAAVFALIFAVVKYGAIMKQSDGNERMKEIARQVRERQTADLIGPPAPVKGWAQRRQVLESYPGGKTRARNGTEQQQASAAAKVSNTPRLDMRAAATRDYLEYLAVPAAVA